MADANVDPDFEVDEAGQPQRAEHQPSQAAADQEPNEDSNLP
jgi:hypothetical protein